MKRTVKGKIYDTKTARLCCSCDITPDFADEFSYMTETLYETSEGDFFLYFDCEPRWELFSQEMQKNLKKIRREIKPISKEEADEWIDEADSIYM